MQSIILGCGDIGRRIINALVDQGHDEKKIIGLVKSLDSAEQCAQMGVIGLRFDLDDLSRNLSLCADSQVYYTVAPQKNGEQDLRTRCLLQHFRDAEVKPKKVVVISTTGVYGDCQGDWVTEENNVNPQTARGQRRLDSEQNWLAWGKETGVPVVILRVPGIYAHSRLPKARIEQRTPVVNQDECGYTNRVHADDLALMCVAAMRKAKQGQVFNATDGTPGKISEYIQEAAKVLGQAPLPEISLTEAQDVLSAGMLSYLSESRKISNEKILTQLDVSLRYPDFREGMKY